MEDRNNLFTHKNGRKSSSHSTGKVNLKPFISGINTIILTIEVYTFSLAIINSVQQYHRCDSVANQK